MHCLQKTAGMKQLQTESAVSCRNDNAGRLATQQQNKIVTVIMFYSLVLANVRFNSVV